MNCVLVAQHGDQLFAVLNTVLNYSFFQNKRNVLTELIDCENLINICFMHLVSYYPVIM